MKLACLFRQKGVLASLVDDVVKALVRIVVGIRFLLGCLANAIIMRSLELRSRGSVIRRAARAPHMPSSAAITSNRSTTSLKLSEATKAPRRGCSSTNPVEASCISASRIGVRETSNLSCQALLVQAIAGAILACNNVLLEGVSEGLSASHLIYPDHRIL